MSRVCIPHIDWLERHTGLSAWTMTMYGVEGGSPRTPISKITNKWLEDRTDHCSIEFGSIVMAEYLISILNELNCEIAHMNLRYECSQPGNKYKIKVITSSIDEYTKRGENVSRAIGILE